MSTTESEQLLPHALPSEKFVLSAFMKDAERLASYQMEPEVFYLPAHQSIYRRMLEEPLFDLSFFPQRLHDHGELDAVGGPAAITDIYTYAVGQNFEERFQQTFRRHLEIVHDRHRRRRAIRACQAATRAAYDCAEGEAGGEYLRTLGEPIAGILADAPTNGRKLGFPIFRADSLGGHHEATDFVENLLTDGGASVVYGPSNVGKSFWILDLAAHVATGRTWRDDVEVDQGAVVYVALEGSTGIQNRKEALMREGRLPEGAPLFLCFSPVSLLERGHAEMLARSVKEAASLSKLPCKLVVLDTMARAMAGGNENAGEDMTAAVASIDAIRAATGAHVAVIHHTGKDEAKGARGHSSLRAAVDTELEIFRPEGEHISTVRVTKQRDLECREPMPFSLRKVVLGTNRRRKEITSCVVKHEDEMMAADRKKPGRPKGTEDVKILALLPQPSTSAWRKVADAKHGITKSTFYRAIEKLRGNGAIEGADGRWFKQ